jgi:ADP-ribose pyrophosphatase
MTEILLKASKFSVERRRYRLPGGREAQGEVAVHPGAVLILPLLSPSRILMIRNYRFAVGRELLELPAGTLEPPETAEACALRELEEETGYVAGQIEPLCQFYTSPGFTDERMHVFVASGLTAAVQRLEETENIQVEVMDLSDALRATADGRIVDGKTIAALHVYHYREAR